MGPARSAPLEHRVAFLAKRGSALGEIFAGSQIMEGSGLECEGLVHNDTVIAVDLPQFVELAVVETDPGVRGDTAQGGNKPAKLETGAVVNVPLFIEIGDVLKVDRTENKYLTRV